MLKYGGNVHVSEIDEFPSDHLVFRQEFGPRTSKSNGGRTQGKVALREQIFPGPDEAK